METPNKMIGGIAGAMTGGGGNSGTSNPGRIDIARMLGQDTTGLAVQPQQITNVPPAASSLINPFSPEAQQNAQGMYGGIGQRQQSVGAPFMFADQTGDGKITQADVIKARTKGYKK